MHVFVTFLKALTSGIFTGLIVSIPLGPAGIESIKRTITTGYKKGFTLSIGALCGDATYMTCSYNSNIKAFSNKSHLNPTFLSKIFQISCL